MKLKLRSAASLLATVVALSLATAPALAQQDTAPKKRLRNPATVRGFIGGESHDSYVIRGRKGRTMTVRISWRREGDNRAEFTVSESPDFFGAEPVTFGKESDDGKRWAGKLPRTRDYYIYVVAHPTAQYTLRVTIR
jgi:hypothetical protein